MDCAKAGIAELQDQLTGSLIGIARAVDGNEHLISDSTNAIVWEGLAASLPGADADQEVLSALIQRTEDEKRKLVPLCYECASPCGKTSSYDMRGLWNADEDVCSLKLLLLSGIRNIAACHAAAPGHTDREVSRYLYQVLFFIGEESFGMGELLPVAAKFRKIYQLCTALPDGAGS